jgi:hypothetical protein
MIITEIRRYINLILEFENSEIKYFGKVSNDDQKGVEQKGRKVIVVASSDRL